MPQMAPLSWILLFFLFFMMFMMFNIKNYFNFMETPSNKESSTPTLYSMNWKW